MKRMWLGVAILSGLLCLGIVSAVTTEHSQETVSRDLRFAARAAEAGEWDTAGHCFLQARETWQKDRNRNAAITDHTPMEEIDRFFAQGNVYLAEQARVDFSACCCALSVLVEAVAEAQSLTWWSLF